MKRLGAAIFLVAALALPATALAGNRAGGARFDAHLARATAHVNAYVARCDVDAPPAKCANRHARLTARLTTWAARIQAKIDAVSQRPDSDRKTARLARLQDKLAQISALQAQL